MNERQMQVELDVFSGRPNPTWPLTAEEQQELIAQVDRLASVTPGHAPAALGYRGFIVHRIERVRSLPWLRVGVGTVQITKDRESRSYRDTVGIEEWFREQAIARGFGALVPSARS